MIDITGSDIQLLNDTDLRSLIGLLCEADLHALGLSTSGVTWGGNQNAPDGGIDVRVTLSSQLPDEGYIPRANTGFQVKKPDMPRSAIIDEMRPKGVLRPAIGELVNSGGAYIIVSSQGSCSDSALADRRSAMQEAIADVDNMKIDFYDRDRVAGWVRSHPSLILWVKEKIGQLRLGWKGYGNWTNTPGGVFEEYIQDEHIRLYSDTSNHLDRSNGISIIEGIYELRTKLQRYGSSVRLIGLSGVGKTRLLQALFDERIGTNALSKSIVYYSDVSDNPVPEPVHFAESLCSLNTPAILVIDNCSSALHSRLTSICTAPNSSVSLITVEYDVRDDQPELTHIFRLEPNSNELIQKIISKRFPLLSEVNARTIAKLSDGNARVAIALSNTIESGENLARVRDDELFNRLFEQRKKADSSLMKAAEICSIVYSFSIETTEENNDELKLLGSLIGMSVNDLYLNIRELQRRELIQKRGVWRAILPQAIANRLAQTALENIPLDLICNTFEYGASERFLKSFSRRLSYLPNSSEANMITKKWLSDDGLLSQIGNLNKLGIQLLENVAPVNPQLVLESIERTAANDIENEAFLTLDNPHYDEITKILRSIAYDKRFFNRCCRLLIHFALSNNAEDKNPTHELFKSLFYIHLSGTHATPEQRLNVITELVESTSEEQFLLGLSLLDAALEVMHFSSYHEFDFGAHSRDYGFAPQTKDDFQNWYKIFLGYTVTISLSNQPLAYRARVLLAEKFGGLWIKTGLYDELEHAALKISVEKTWLEGLVAIKTTLSFNKDEFPVEILHRLISLENMLEPKKLSDRVRLFSFSIKNSDLNLLDTTIQEDEQVLEQLNNTIRLLGQELACDYKLFTELLPEMLNQNSDRLFELGKGLAIGCTNLEQMWLEFYYALSSNLCIDTNNTQALCGFFNVLTTRNNNLAMRILNQAVTDKVLAPIFMHLQINAQLDDQGMNRIRQSIQYGAVPIQQYVYIAYGRYHENISDNDYCEIMRDILLKADGFDIVLDMFCMRIQKKQKII